MRLLTAALLATAAFTAPASAAERIVNGSFESNVIPNGSFQLRTPATQGVTGWNITNGNVDIVRGFGGSTAADGAQWLDLTGEAAGTISQTFNTVVGRIYTFTFQYGHNDLGGAQSRSATYSVGGLSGTITHTGPGFNYVTFLPQTFIGTGSPTTLTFTSLNGDGNAGIALDGVSISAVPEPASWAMMIMGFGLIGWAMRRRAKSSLRLHFA